MSITKEIGKNPKVDWIVVLAVSIFLAIILIIGAIYLYKVVTKDNMNDADASKINVSKVFDSEALLKVINSYSQKEEINKKARVKYDGLGDPSL